MNEATRQKLRRERLALQGYRTLNTPITEVQLERLQRAAQEHNVPIRQVVAVVLDNAMRQELI